MARASLNLFGICLACVVISISKGEFRLYNEPTEKDLLAKQVVPRQRVHDGPRDGGYDRVTTSQVEGENVESEKKAEPAQNEEPAAPGGKLGALSSLAAGYGSDDAE
ncbi:hypothetical protein HKX48_005324 [Thoreauomyces humboldtii]|nr:hypothetical protein HKX48_005324 [Thoreauomyces humboldtii]